MIVLEGVKYSGLIKRLKTGGLTSLFTAHVPGEQKSPGSPFLHP